MLCWAVSTSLIFTGPSDSMSSRSISAPRCDMQLRMWLRNCSLVPLRAMVSALRSALPRTLANLAAARPGHPTQMHRPKHISRLAQQAYQRRQQSGEHDDRNHQQRSKTAEFGKEKPGAQHQEHQGNGDEAAPQVVENLPPGQGGKRIGDLPDIPSRDPGQEPLHDLPIAPNPAVAPTDVHVVAGGMFLIELHVADKGGARVARLQQVVA